MTKSAERIEKAKKKYKVAEDAADTFLTRLAYHPYTFAIIVVFMLCVIGAIWQWG